MYNINSHYKNIFNLATSVVPTPSLLYLHPHGATEIKDLETMLVQSDDMLHVSDAIIICYDQEPLIPAYNRPLFEHIITSSSKYLQKFKSIILLNTEIDSDNKDEILNEFKFIDCYYFHHIFAAHDWFREYYYNKKITDPSTRKLSKKFITLNRLTSYARIYRSLLINELIERDLLNDGYISYSTECPIGGSFDEQLITNGSQYNISDSMIDNTIKNINNLESSLRIDFKTHEYIPNMSFSVEPIHESLSSFLYIVTETNYWGRRKHLTEKIFKPIILKQPFILVGCAYNLEYLKSYGFKTFDRWWSEEYDSITDDVQRMHKIGETIQTICKYNLNQLEEILKDMQEILDYNYNLFYSRDFIDSAWAELETNLTDSILRVKY